MRGERSAKGEFAQRLLQGLNEALEHAQGKRKLTSHVVTIEIEVPEYKPDQIRSIRDSLGLSQSVFASVLGTSKNTVAMWEQGKRHPSQMARRFLNEIETNPKHWKSRVSKIVTRKKSKKAAV